MSSSDKKNANAALGKMAGQMGTNKSTTTQSVQSAMSGMTGQERNAATKMLNNMKQNGQNPKNAGEFAAAAQSMVGDDDQNGTQGTQPTNENINAAHWPVDSMGQYKGEPFSTDYGKLKPNPKTAAKTEGGAKETTVEEPKVEGSKAPESEAPKSEKPKGNPFAKKEEPKDEAESDDAE